MNDLKGKRERRKEKGHKQAMLRLRRLVSAVAMTLEISESLLSVYDWTRPNALLRSSRMRGDDEVRVNEDDGDDGNGAEVATGIDEVGLFGEKLLVVVGVVAAAADVDGRETQTLPAR